ncbi:MAG TPA: sugar ABC transporter substrate-binding protein [Spirochaetia bacterium]|nr:sugar ABC transporter substrate-binding protein [Spirochaetia bacterium]
MNRVRITVMFGLAMMVLLAGSLFASGKTESTGATQATSAQPVTISFTWWGADVSRDKKYNDIADAFEKSHPNIKIARQFPSWNDYWPKLTTQVAGGNAPDVMGMHQTKEADFVHRGALLDLDPFVKDGTIDLSGFPKSVVEAGMLDNKILMVAQGVTMTGYLYDTGMFDKLGVKYPTNNWTWDDFGAMAQQLYKAMKAKGMDGWGANDDSSGLTSLIVWTREHGKEVFDANGKLGVNVQDMIDWFTMWDNLRKTGALPDAASTVQYRPLGVQQTMFVKGLVPMSTIPFNQMPNYQRYITDGNVDGVLRPKIAGGQNGQFVEGSYLAIASTSKYQKQAAEFINYFVNSADASKIFMLEQGAMGNSKMNDVVMPMLSPVQQRMIKAIQGGLDVATKIPVPPAGENQVETSALRDAADAVAFGKLSIPDAAQQFVTQATKILQQQ